MFKKKLRYQFKSPEISKMNAQNLISRIQKERKTHKMMYWNVSGLLGKLGGYIYDSLLKETRYTDAPGDLG